MVVTAVVAHKTVVSVATIDYGCIVLMVVVVTILTMTIDFFQTSLAYIATISMTVVCDIGMGVIAFALVALFVVTVSAVFAHPTVASIVVGDYMDAVTRVITFTILAN